MAFSTVFFYIVLILSGTSVLYLKKTAQYGKFCYLYCRTSKNKSIRNKNMLGHTLSPCHIRPWCRTSVPESATSADTCRARGGAAGGPSRPPAPPSALWHPAFQTSPRHPTTASPRAAGSGGGGRVVISWRWGCFEHSFCFFILKEAAQGKNK